MEYCRHNLFKQQIKTKIKEFATYFSPNNLIDIFSSCFSINNHPKIEEQEKRDDILSIVIPWGYFCDPDPENDHYELEIKEWKKKKKSKLSQPMYLSSTPTIDENKGNSGETFLSSSSIKNNKDSFSNLFDYVD